MEKWKPLNRLNWYLLLGSNPALLCTGAPQERQSRGQGAVFLLVGGGLKENQQKLFFVCMNTLCFCSCYFSSGITLGWHDMSYPFCYSNLTIIHNFIMRQIMRLGPEWLGFSQLWIMCKVVTEGGTFLTLVHRFPLLSPVCYIGFLFFCLSVKGTCKQ